MTEQEFSDYVDSLKPGEAVIETNRTCMHLMRGVVYISDNPGVTFGSKCVMWKNKMGTSVTWGTRRITDWEK